MTQLKKAVEREDSQLAIVVLTTIEQVQPEMWQRRVENQPQMQQMAWNLEKPNLLVKEIARKLEMPCLNLLPAFREAAEERGVKLYYERDHHWNVEGHRLAGELIYKWLIKSEMVPLE